MLCRSLGAGRTLGAYKIDSHIGCGGVADVYKAINQETGAVVALKCLRACHSSNFYIKQRMAAEASLLLGLQHDNVVRVTDVGIEEDGLLWMAMEFLSGATLRALLRAYGALPLTTALYYAREIADGVAAAHELHVIHRDLKPENVMITDKNEVKVLDMGAAKFCDWQVGNTITGAVIGTPLYMSPEHIQGDTLDARADVYSLGLILYEMLAGHHPLLPDGGRALSQYEICEKQIFYEPKPLASFIEACPREVSEFIQKTISKERDQRPWAMTEFAGEVRKLLKSAIKRGDRLDSLPAIDIIAASKADSSGDAQEDSPLDQQPAAQQSRPAPLDGEREGGESIGQGGPRSPQREVVTKEEDDDITRVFTRPLKPLSAVELEPRLAAPSGKKIDLAAPQQRRMTNQRTEIIIFDEARGRPGQADTRRRTGDQPRALYANSSGIGNASPTRPEGVGPPAPGGFALAFPSANGVSIAWLPPWGEAWTNLVSEPYASELRRVRFMEGSLRVLLGSSLVTLVLLFGHSLVTSIVSFRSPNSTAPSSSVNGPQPIAPPKEPRTGTAKPQDTTPNNAPHAPASTAAPNSKSSTTKH